MRKGQKENSKETNDLQLSYDMNAWVEGEKEKTPPSRPCLDISTIRSPPTTSCPMMCIRWLSWPGCLIRQSPRHEIVMNGSDTFFRAMDQFYRPVLLLYYLSPGCVFSLRNLLETHEAEWKNSREKEEHLHMYRFFLCFHALSCTQKIPYDDQKKKYEKRSRTTRRHRPHSLRLQ